MSFTNKELLDVYTNLKKFAYKLTKNTDACEDLLSETVVRMLEKNDQFISGSNLFPWGSRIMFTLFATHYRRSKKRDTMYDPEPYIMALTSLPNQESYTLLGQLLQEINKLPRHMIEVLMAVMEGKSYDEISAETNISVGTIRSRISRARQQITDRGFE